MLQPLLSIIYWHNFQEMFDPSREIWFVGLTIIEDPLDALKLCDIFLYFR
jgi:hypothetical protein